MDVEAVKKETSMEKEGKGANLKAESEAKAKPELSMGPGTE
jgi:hypothetical protein